MMIHAGRYLANKRWYTGKDHTPQLRFVDLKLTSAPAAALAAGAEVQLQLAVDTAGDNVHYFMPTIHTPSPIEQAADFLIGRVDGRYCYDAVGLPAFGRFLAAALNLPGEFRRSRLLGVEQSNTSLVITTSSEEVIVKIFRVLQPGENPDASIQTALQAVGCEDIPTPRGTLQASWRPRGSHVAVRGDIAIAQTFLASAEDGWQRAVGAATRSDLTFAGETYQLGRALARVHAQLVRAFDTNPPIDVAGLTARWQSQLAEAISYCPDLASEREHIEAIFIAAASCDTWPSAQRIHGDFHLGQTLWADGAWKLVDFEGEPLRPLAERLAPDAALRDVAGMVRSIDYAGATGAQQASTDGRRADRSEWTRLATAAFLAGYRDESGGELDERLLKAFVLEKALYEIVYEARNRPAWLAIPRNGITQLWEDKNMDPIPVDHDILMAVAHGTYHEPHAVLGGHPDGENVTLRVRRPGASSVEIITEDATYPMRHELEGVWVAVLPGNNVPDYRVRATYQGDAQVSDDAYRFLPSFGELDGHLFAAGRHEDLWRVMGAHVQRYPSALGDVCGVSFTVWAPNARAVQVRGDFNGWDGANHAMRSLGASGVWEIFIPEAKAGDCYKFLICTPDGAWVEKADPMARGTKIPPDTASVVVESTYEWGDQEWMERRAGRDPHQGPMSIYEVHLGSWRQGLHYRALAHELTEYVTSLGFTHVEFMPVAEHPFGGSWGYQVTGYYAPTARFGSPDDFKYLVDCLHQAGIGVIVDWVPAHFPKDDWALARFDGTPLYEDPDPLRGEHPDWGTLVFNFGRNEVRNFLVANALYWLEEFHVDGLRVDAVASMLYLDYSRTDGQWRPNQFGGRENLEALQFLQEANATAYRRCPGIVMIAEESTAWPGVTSPTDAGGLGFGMKWNMGWMNDTLRYIAEEPINRCYHHGLLTFSLVYAFSEQFILPFSHDEVVHGKGSLKRKMPGDWWQQLAGVRAILAYQWSHPGKQLLFMGQEFAQDSEWNDQDSLDWWLLDNPTHAGVAELVGTMNELYRKHPALWDSDFNHRGFQWIQADDAANNVLTFLRQDSAGDDVVVCVVNFAGTPHENYRIGLPRGGAWKEILNTDASVYGGSGVGNLGEIQAEELSWDGRQYSARLRVPPLGALWFTPAETSDTTE